jgi:hypothetical protein
MNINFNVDLNKLQQRQQQKAKTGLSMQNTVNNAFHLPTQNPTTQLPAMNNSNGWGANAQ